MEKKFGSGDDTKTVCGPGSTFEATRHMIKILHNVVDHLKVILVKDKISLLDSSCGDMFWMPEFLMKRDDVVYTGYDLTDSNINANNQKFREGCKNLSEQFIKDKIRYLISY